MSQRNFSCNGQNKEEYESLFALKSLSNSAGVLQTSLPSEPPFIQITQPVLMNDSLESLQSSYLQSPSTQQMIVQQRTNDQYTQYLLAKYQIVNKQNELKSILNQYQCYTSPQTQHSYTETANINELPHQFLHQSRIMPSNATIAALNTSSIADINQQLVSQLKKQMEQKKINISNLSQSDQQFERLNDDTQFINNHQSNEQDYTDNNASQQNSFFSSPNGQNHSLSVDQNIQVSPPVLQKKYRKNLTLNVSTNKSDENSELSAYLDNKYQI